jgi:chromate reductase, NAD(P)H dehydrogenase (quinone)
MRQATNETVRIAGISGSLRKASFSTALLKILAEKALPSIEIQVVTLEDIPLYNEDLDREPQIPGVAAFKRIIAESDGVLIATSEYNHGIPGVLKNALDWASRPVFESCFKHKPVSIISSSLAFTGGVRAQYQLRETLISMQAHLVVGPEVVVGGVHTSLAQDVYTNENGLAFMLKPLGRLRDEILGRRLAAVPQWQSQVKSLQSLVAELLAANECLREDLHDHELHR